MTVDTQQFPVATVRRVVIVVVVLVMDRQLSDFPAGEFAHAARTDPGINLERFGPVGLILLTSVASSLGSHPVQLVVIRLLLFCCHVIVLDSSDYYGVIAFGYQIRLQM